jgi:hypothetical protein
MSPGKHWADDDTCSYMAMALTVAMDLSLNKLVVPCPRLPQVNLENIPKSECITASKALALDGFSDVNPDSAWAQRLLRGRERIWLALFVLDRGLVSMELYTCNLLILSVGYAWLEGEATQCL